VPYLDRRNKRIKRDRAATRQIRRKPWNGPRRVSGHIGTSVSGKPAQEGTQVVLSALAEVFQQSPEIGRRQCRGFGKPRVVAVLAGEHRQYDSACSRQGGELIDPVTPPVEPAEQADQNHLGVGADLVDPKIDREWVAKVAQMYESHAWQRILLCRPRRREPG